MHFKYITEGYRRHREQQRKSIMTEDQIKHLVDRFLAWKLPNDFHPDAGIKYTPSDSGYPMADEASKPTGTNLFSATQADAMVRHMIDGMPTP